MYDVTPTGPSHARRMWRFQFSLRTLLLALTAASIGLSFVAVRMANARKQRRAVIAILETGGGVLSDCQWDYQSQRLLVGEPGVPLWLRRLFGDDFFVTVVLAEVKNDGGLEAVRNLPQLRELRVKGQDVTDAGMENIKGLRRLECLRFWGASQLSDASMENVGELTRLRHLDLNLSAVTDTGLERLRRLSQLENLEVQGTRVTDASLIHLAGMRRLRELNLEGTSVTDAGLQYLEGFTELEDLNLQNTKVTDAALVHLEKLHALRKLWLVGSEVTPYGAEHLQHILTTCQIASSKPGGASVSRNEIEGDIEGPFFDWDSLAARIEPAVPGLDVGCAWQVGTALLLWTDIGAKGRSVVSAGTIVTISDDDGRKVHFQWVENGKNNVARITINGIGYDVAKGNAFLVSTRGRQYRVKQLKRDLTQLKFDPAPSPQFSKDDIEITGFFRASMPRPLVSKTQ